MWEELRSESLQGEVKRPEKEARSSKCPEVWYWRTSQSRQGYLRSQAHLAVYTGPHKGASRGLWELLQLCSFYPCSVCGQASTWWGARVASGQQENKHRLPLSITVPDCNHLLRDLNDCSLLCLMNLMQVPLLANFNLESCRERDSGEHSSQPYTS